MTKFEVFVPFVLLYFPLFTFSIKIRSYLGNIYAEIENILNVHQRSSTTVHYIA